MTRWARGQAKREHDPTPWNELNDNSHQNKKRKTLNKDAPGLEKRQAARRIRRLKSKPCFHCRQTGHLVSGCPEKQDNADAICYKCGSTEHSVHDCKVNVKDGEYPFAKCFICKENGHLSRNCPSNPRGLYPDGGGCKFCDSVEHYGRDCPEGKGGQEKSNSHKNRMYRMCEVNESIDAIVPSDDENSNVPIVKKDKPRVVKF